MLLLVYFIILFFLYNFRKQSTPGLYLILIYILSLLCGLLIGFDFKISTISQAFNLFYLALILSIFILPWNRFNYKINILDKNPHRVYRLTILLFFINGISFLVFSVASYYAFTTITDFSAFKNNDESGAFFQQLPINHTIYLFAIYLNATSYFMIPLHFYYLNKKKYLLSILSLIFSLNIILEGLSVFSRSAFVIYLFLYIFYIPFYYRNMDVKTKRKIKILAIGVLLLTGNIFYIITSNRFGDYLMYGDAKYNQSLIQNPELYSIFDYFAQWYKNSGIVMAGYNFETLNGQLSFPFFLTIADKINLIDYRPDLIVNKLIALWGIQYDKFNGLIPNLLFDFGYIGTTLFALFYSSILQRLKPFNGEISFSKILMLGTMFSLPAMGIFNSSMKSSTYNLVIIYSFFIYLYLNHKSQNCK